MKHSIKMILQKRWLVGTIIVFIIAGGYAIIHGQTGAAETRYVTAPAEKGTLLVSVTGSGQVATATHVEVKAKSSGTITYVGAQAGQLVASGALLAQLDARDGLKAVRDAETNLESARLALEKLKKPADALAVLQAEHALTTAQETKQKAENDLIKAYDDGFNTVANAFLNLPTVITGLHDVLYKNTITSTQANLDYYGNAVKGYDVRVIRYRDNADAAYQAARRAYETNFAAYKTASRFSDRATVELIINQTYDTTKAIAEAVKSTNNLIQFYKDKLAERDIKPVATAETHLTELSVSTGTTNAHLLNLLAIQNSIKTNVTTIVAAERTIIERTAALVKLRAGADELDIKTQELTVRQRQNALADARAALSDYTVRAPFAGVVAKLDIERGEQVGGASVIATVISAQKIAEISLNEVDAARVAVGQDVTLTFDAVLDVKSAGAVVAVDTVGTISQGVVTYVVTVSFATADERVKPGMTTSATIVTDRKTDVLLVPASAVKSQGERWYVEFLEDEKPRRNYVEIGLSNDTVTEIISGLTAGEVVITRTITAAATAEPAARAPSLFSAPGGNRGGGRAGGGFSIPH